jgi:hypothetical protein
MLSQAARRRSTLGRKRSDRDVVLEESPVLSGGLLNAAYRSTEAAKLETVRPAPRHRPPPSANASRMYKIVGAVLALAGIALLIPTARDLFTGGGPKDLIGVLSRLIPGPALVIGGLVLFEKGRLMEPHLFAEVNYDDRESIHSIDAILNSNRVGRPAEPSSGWATESDAQPIQTVAGYDANRTSTAPAAAATSADYEARQPATATSGWPTSNESMTTPVGASAASATGAPTAAPVSPAQASSPTYFDPASFQVGGPAGYQNYADLVSSGAPAPAEGARPAPPRIVPRIAAEPVPSAATPPDALVSAPVAPAAAGPTMGTGMAFEPPAPPAANPAESVPLTPSADVARQVRASMNAADVTLIETYRQWVLGQALGAQTFQPLTVNDRYDEWFLLSASGVATLLAWTHEDHHATYSAETWVDQILPTQGIAISDRQLALDLLSAAALHAGGLHTTPTERLTAYHPSDLVTAMATVHVGLLRLYSGLEGATPAKILRDQLGDSPAPSFSTSADDERRWLPPGS